MTIPDFDVDAVRAELASVRAVYFDLDDTLCGYWDASKAALRETFSIHVRDQHSPEDMVRHWAETYREYAPLIKSDEWYPRYLVSGDETRYEHMRRTLTRIGIHDEDLATALSMTYRQQRRDRLALFPDAIETLEALSGRFPIGLITNGPADIQREEIATLGIGKYFNHVFIEGEMGVGKPIRSVFERAESAVGLPGTEILMVGNSYGHDIRPAVQYGWKTAWLRRPSDVAPSAQPGAKPEEMPADGPVPTLILGALRPLLDLLPLDR